MDGKRTLLAIGMPLLSLLIARSLYSQEAPRLEIQCEPITTPGAIMCSIVAGANLTISRVTINDRDGCDFKGVLSFGEGGHRILPWPQSLKTGDSITAELDFPGDCGDRVMRLRVYTERGAFEYDVP